MNAPKTKPNSASISNTAGKIPRVAWVLGTLQMAQAQLSVGMAAKSPPRRRAMSLKRFLTSASPFRCPLVPLPLR
ncbi:hypothetical protein [Methylacidimicrobium sp. B4]|uniref:hypothetical protein n=1 Tax=Methylacidimicrobium sp. B4 TaxID=2796139 RepID=UPI001A8F956F|nr:hypothetical protein [Methylacidimicrobium sp. B4]QSR85702.1 hypothetical protein MacB4_05665 [Methylacidimicrobium sp. B4]